MKNTGLCEVWSEFHLPEELWPGILCRLPVKSLLRFRCISKSWLSLIDDAEFSRLHLKNFKNNCHETHLLIVHSGWRKCVVRCSDTFETISEALPISNVEESWDFVCSIDGLVLLKRIRSSPSSLSDLNVWNPSIRKFHEFPSLPEIKASPDSKFMDLEIGLGYDPLANDYKYVKLILLNYTLHSVAIYTLGTESWKIIQFQGKGCSWRWDVCIIKWTKKVYLRGSLYFMARDEKNHSVWELVSFDLSSEVFSSMKLPDDPYFKTSDFKRWNELTLIDSGCSVAVFNIFSTDDKSVWVLENSRDESESLCWTKRYSFHSNDIQRFLYLKKNGDILTWRCLQETLAAETGEKSVTWEQLRSYSPETDEYKILEQREDFSYMNTHASAYVESLIMLKQLRNR